MALGVDELRGKPPAITRGPVTGRVTRVDAQGVWVVPVGGDLRTPVGPCRGPSDIPVGTVVMVIYTQERPWVFGAELLTVLNAEVRDLALLEAAAADAHELLNAHAADTTDVHGIVDTTALETQTGAQTRADDAQAAAEATAADALALHAGDTDNPHSVTKAQVGLGNVDDTSDADKPISTAAAAALADKLDASAYLDSGRRLVVAAGVVTDLPDLEVVLRRRGDVVTVWTREATTLATHAGATALYTLPAGFRPDPALVAAPVLDETGADIATLLVAAAGGALTLTAVAGERHHGSLTYLTSDTWPGSLPGTEDT